MTMDTILEIPLALIDDTDRLREVDPAWAEALAGHIKEQGRGIKGRGLQTPVEVRQAGEDGTHRLVFGAHRVTACRLLGWKTIPARVFDGSDLEARLEEIDENLVRRELGPLERAIFLAERKRVYLAMHPDAGRGKAGANKRWHAKTILGFAHAVTKKIGLSVTAVDRDIAMAEALAPDVRGSLQEERLALTGAQLRILAGLTHEQQRVAVVKKANGVRFGDAIAQAGGAKPVKVAPEEAQFRALLAAWGKNTDPKARSRFLAEIAPRKKALAA